MDTTPHDIVLTLHRKPVTPPFIIGMPPVDGETIPFSGIKMSWKAPPLTRLYLAVRNKDGLTLAYYELSSAVLTRLDKDDALSGEIPYRPFYYIVTKYRRSGIRRPQRLMAGTNGVLHYDLNCDGAMHMRHFPFNNKRALWHGSQDAFTTKAAASIQAIADMEKEIRSNAEIAKKYLMRSNVLRRHIDHPDTRRQA